MRSFIGASGAQFEQSGQVLIKRCHNAFEQAAWLRTASILPLEDGVRCVEVYAADADAYMMEHITGHLATEEPTTQVTHTLYAQVNRWRYIPPTSNATWHQYLDRLEDHCAVAQSATLWDAYAIICHHKGLTPSFNHGDLTYENIVIQSDNTLVLIDPNFAPNIYQSFILDYGKMLQSTHTDYHRIFKSNTGINLEMQDEALCHLLKAAGHYEDALLACLSHVVRLAKYRLTEIDKVEALAQPLIRELTCTS
jgi:hypothetical protein